MFTFEDKEAKKIINAVYSKDSDFWMKRSKAVLLDLFKLSNEKVKAYPKFLKSQHIIPENIKNYRDFLTVPPVTKDSYLRKYAWEELTIKDSLKNDSLVLTSTSGSTGKPFYFPRNGILDYQSSVYHELFLKNSGIDTNKSTLVVVCFGMGVWIGGVITYQAFKKISERGSPMTIITPGVNKQEIYEALKNIAPKYDQVILCGYPPFMKDLIDEAGSHGVNWKKFDLKIVFAAEAFSETFRDYIAKKTGIKNIYRDTMNIYGSADLGTMAQETPLSILIRRLAVKNKKLYSKLFNEATRLPTFAQFIPDFITFEAVNKEIYCSGNNVLPLVRYRIGDHGGVTSFNDVAKIFDEEGLNLSEEIKKAGIQDSVTELPFVYIYERSDFSTKLYGAIIYPEYIKEGLLHSDLSPYLTGKFTLVTEHDKNQNEYLEVNVEMKENCIKEKRLIKKVNSHIMNSLLEKSAEYKYLSNSLKERVKPRIILWPYGHKKFFAGGTKQKWVKLPTKVVISRV